MDVAQQLAMLARTCLALQSHRRGCKAGRYYRRLCGDRKVLNFEELCWPPTCSASKSAAVADVAGELARSLVREPQHGHAIGAGRCGERRSQDRVGIETILTGYLC